jgi:uncharacterized LabA/DUF88 family protein/cold shock CspA family protein
MLKTGIYVDAENIRLSGGYGMRYDILVDLANSGESVMLRANSYLAEDGKRTREDAEYRQKLYHYHNVIRSCGFKLIKKYVTRYVDEDGQVTTKANADMDLAIDALLQSRNLDRVILVTGDGDFVRLVTALQNKGCRVEVIGFKNVSGALREAADSFISGYLIPGLLPISGGDDWFRGTPINYNPDRGFGFLKYYRMSDGNLQGDTVFFHFSQAAMDNDQPLRNSSNIFEFKIVNNPSNNNRPEAREIVLLEE